VRDLGADVVAELCQRLLDGGAPGLHFYTINRARATIGVLERLAAR
jgi:methylenetetrahydrofolate reductase (NADPH)